jgi:hypothetical protein
MKTQLRTNRNVIDLENHVNKEGNAMKTKNPLGMALVTVIFVFGLVIFLPIAKAEQPVDFTDYFYATVTPLSTSPELTIFQSEVKGVIQNASGNKIFDNLTSYCLRLGKVVAGKMSYTTYTKFTDPEGDYFITEATAEAVPAGVFEAAWKFLHGTGKWKGVKGGGTSKTIFMTRGKQQLNPTTFQGYLRMTGTFELPK